MASKNIVIDGSILEGGGQILRNSASLSCLLKEPITINNIRAGRNNPGLRPQHLKGLELIRDVCGGTLTGGIQGSTEISLHPGTVQSGEYLADTKTAGSVTLLLQATLPCLLFAPKKSQITLKGGTNADMAPPIDYLTWVLQPMVQYFGINFECDIVRRGFFPRGGGVVNVSIEPVKHLEPIIMTDPGHIVQITGLAYCAGVLPPKVAYSMAHTAERLISQKLNIQANIDTVKEPDNSIGNGNGIILMAETSTGCLLASTALGKKGVSAERVGQEAAEKLIQNIQSGSTCDEHLQDQLIIFMALAKGKSSVLCGPITLHTQTAIHIAETLTAAKFQVKEVNKNTNLIECEGIGLENHHI